MSAQIDWGKAPEGTTGHGNIGISHLYVWFSDKWYEYVNSNHGGRYYFGDARTYKIDDISCVTYRPTTQSWSGEGLPPVGVVCEVAPDNSLWGFSTLEIRKCLVIAYHDDFVWLDTFVPGIPVATRVDKVTFRPIRTPEQIAADERGAAIRAMIEDGDGRGLYVCLEDVLGRLHDAGYRKQPTKQDGE